MSSHRMFMCKAVPETSYERASEVAAALAIASAGPEKIFPRFAARWVTRTNAWCAETYQEWGEHPIGSWRRRLRDLGAWALDRIPPEETTLGGLPPVVSSVEVAYPQSADVRVVERLLRDELLGAKADLTRRRAWVNAGVMPLFLPLAVTPLSNVPIYWVGWRAWMQWRASTHGVAARDFLQNSAVDGRYVVTAHDGYDPAAPCTRLENDVPAEDGDTVCCRVESTGAGPCVMFVPCARLDSADEPLRACNRAGGVASSFQKIHEDTETALWRLDRVVASGASDLARRYRRARALGGGKET